MVLLRVRVQAGDLNRLARFEVVKLPCLKSYPISRTDIPLRPVRQFSTIPLELSITPGQPVMAVLRDLRRFRIPTLFAQAFCLALFHCSEKNGYRIPS